MASSEKRCYYEVLGLGIDCSADEIRSAYRKLALQRHPDKLVQSGLTQAEATASFQELVNAYQVLSDARERAWYDSHRSQILFSDPTSANSASVPDLFSFFSNSVFSGYGDTAKGFYKVYSDLFDKIYANEVTFAKKLGLGLGLVKEAPVMGNLDCPYSQVTAFYGYWLGFCTVMDFVWVDQYDAMAGPNRKSRRVMEEENKKLRKKARREYNETVRGLAEFVKKRDKRVIDMQVKKSVEIERKREEERERRREVEREKLERARAYEEPEWARVVEDEEEGSEEFEDERKRSDGNGNGKELYCVVCGKKFKSDKQWKNHEQSKKHREKVAELRESFDDEKEVEDEVEEEEGNGEVLVSDVDVNNVDRSELTEDCVDELREQFEGSFGVREEQSEDETQYNDEEEFVVHGVNHNVNKTKGLGDSFGSDDETSILEAMVSGHKSKKNVASMHQPKVKEDHVAIDSDEMDVMEYESRKSIRRNRGAKRERGKKSKGDDAKGGDNAETNSQTVENNGHGSSHAGDSSSHSFAENETNGRGDHQLERNHKIPNQDVDRKGTNKRETSTKSKNSSKGRKSKVTPRDSGHICETCGEDFESRNRLHKHLGDTGHAKLKSR